MRLITSGQLVRRSQFVIRTNYLVRVNKASSHQKNLDVGANLFIGNLDPEIDEKLLYDTFSAFGVILQTPKIMRDPDTGNSKGWSLIFKDDFMVILSFRIRVHQLFFIRGRRCCARSHERTIPLQSTHNNKVRSSKCHTFIIKATSLNLQTPAQTNNTTVV